MLKPAHSLSTLRSHDYPWTTQDGFLGDEVASPRRDFNPLGYDVRFLPVLLRHGFLLTQACAGAPKSTSKPTFYSSVACHRAFVLSNEYYRGANVSPSALGSIFDDLSLRSVASTKADETIVSSVTTATLTYPDVDILA
jgi:hypothetical protein